MTSKGTVLITGGAGYVGSYIALELLKNNYSLIALDNFINSYGSLETDLPEPLKRVENITGKRMMFYNANICDENALSKIFKSHKIDYVIHLAGLKSIGESVKSPLDYYQVNVTGSITLFQIMQHYDVKKLIFSSSSNVYGSPQFLPVDETHPTGQNCTSPYGKSKYFVEQILKDMCAADLEFKVITLRYYTPVGAHESGLIGEGALVSRNIMPTICQVGLGYKEKLSVLGSDHGSADGTAIRDYTHVMDLAVGHVLALQKISDPKFNSWDVYNMGAGKGHSVLQLIEAFSKSTGKEIKYEIINKRTEDISKNYSNSAKAKKELAWTPTRDISAMCQDAWRWHSQSPNGYKTM